MSLTDEQWAVVQPLLPPPSPALRGRPPIEDRLILDSILWKLRTASPWYDLSPGYPSHQTCYRRYCRWRKQGILSSILTALDHDLRDRAGLDIRAVLAKRLIYAEQDGPDYYLVLHPALKPTLTQEWQIETAQLFLAILTKMVIKKLTSDQARRVMHKSSHLFGQSPPRPDSYPPL